MQAEFAKAQKFGMILIDNTYETPKGKYNIIIRRYEDQIYFYKYRDEVLLEIRNLNKAMPKPVK